jgi:hypothetical protein
MFDLLKRPEYVHVLINPLPIYGLAMGTVALGAALLMRSRPAQILALWLVFLSALSAGPAFLSGHQAYHQVYVLADADGQVWLDHHMHRAEKLIYMFCVLAAATGSALVVPRKKPKAATPLAAIIVVLSVGTLAVGALIAHPGGKIRHSEFRVGVNGTNHPR